MSTPTHRPYFLVCRPEQINGRMAAHGGKLLLNVLNYTELLVERPVLTDDNLQVFEVEVGLDQVRVQPEGDREVHLVWAGEKHARNRPSELVTISVRSLVGFVSDGAVQDPLAVAGALFADYPPAVQLAAVLVNLDDVTLVDAGLDPAKARTWAKARISSAETAAAAGG